MNIHARQMQMARNIAKMHSKLLKQYQAHQLCNSLKLMLQGKL